MTLENPSSLLAGEFDQSQTSLTLRVSIGRSPLAYIRRLVCSRIRKMRVLFLRFLCPHSWECGYPERILLLPEPSNWM